MTRIKPEARARHAIDADLARAGWVVQDRADFLNVVPQRSEKQPTGRWREGA